jgi:protein SCO1/2
MRTNLTKSRVAWLVAFALISAGYEPALAHDPASSLIEKSSPRRQIHLPVKDFSLTDHSGNTFTFGALRDKVVLVGFIYTTCPDVCPLVTANMRVVQEKLGPAERNSAHFLSVTTDPEVDTPEVLRAYAERYRLDLSNWHFLTGDPSALSQVWKAFGVRVERKARGLVSHTTLTALVDQKGVMRFAYYGTSPDPKLILRDMRGLLAKRGRG